MILGVHCSVSGGLENSFTEAQRLGIDAMQIFSRNQRQWAAKPVSPQEKLAFHTAAKDSEVEISFSHCSYLINLAADNPDIREKSIKALSEEVIRCSELGLKYCVLHPGAAGTQSMETAIYKIAEALNMVLTNTPGSKVTILLENTAGQGTSVGRKFENLKSISQQVNGTIGYCFDTCHAFVAGYDIRTTYGAEKTFQEFDTILGLENLKVFHLNDSKGEFNSHLDRHENIGKGKLGLEPFKYIINEFKHIPKVLETPKEENGDEINLALLRTL
jgi:deoxyribonuclease IV